MSITQQNLSKIFSSSLSKSRVLSLISHFEQLRRASIDRVKLKRESAMFIKSFVLLIVASAICECYQSDIGVKGRPGQSIKSYGGYFHDTSGFNQAENDLAYEQTYHRPIVSSYQPYGWNFNQPARTYGKLLSKAH